MYFYEEDKLTYVFYQESSEECLFKYKQHGTFVLISDLLIEVIYFDPNFTGFRNFFRFQQSKLVVCEFDLAFTYSKTEDQKE